MVNYYLDFFIYKINRLIYFQPQNEHIELHRKRHGRRFDHYERERKREGRMGHDRSLKAQKLRGIKAKLYNKTRHAEKVQMQKT